VDGGLGDTGAPESGQERLEEMQVTVPAVHPELAVVAHVVAQQEPTFVPALYQLAGQFDDSRFLVVLGEARRRARKSNSSSRHVE